MRESPWSAVLISLAVHVAVFATLLRVVWQDRSEPPRQIIAEAWLGPSGGGGGAPAPERKPAAGNTADGGPITGRTTGVVSAAQDDDLKRLIGTFDAGAQDVLPAGLAAVSAPGSQGLGLGGGSGGGTAGGGVPGLVGGEGPVSGFFGQRGNAYKVVYVIDTSGSLMTIFEPVQRALIDSIEQLRPTQSFHVIFAGAAPVELPARRLVPAIAAYKDPARKFIREIVPEARCDPVAAMQRAFAVGPELIYFLTDGDFLLAAPELLAKLRTWNADRRVHITTIGFGPKLAHSRVAGQPVGEPLLRQIAHEHGGNFRWVDDPEEQK